MLPQPLGQSLLAERHHRVNPGSSQGWDQEAVRASGIDDDDLSYADCRDFAESLARDPPRHSFRILKIGLAPLSYHLRTLTHTPTISRI
jgi:hypothetical protein